MAAPSHRRRTISELDMSSMRRISDALLLAQNRARRATDRANQAEQYVIYHRYNCCVLCSAMNDREDPYCSIAIIAR